jgi:hypothetical protein
MTDTTQMDALSALLDEKRRYEDGSHSWRPAAMRPQATSWNAFVATTPSGCAA